MGVGYLCIVSRLVIIQHHIGYCINLDFLAIFFDMDCDDDPTLVGRREALKVAYSRLQPCHPTLPPTLKDFQVFCVNIAGQVACEKCRQTLPPVLLTLKITRTC